MAEFTQTIYLKVLRTLASLTCDISLTSSTRGTYDVDHRATPRDAHGMTMTVGTDAPRTTGPQYPGIRRDKNYSGLLFHQMR